MSNRLIVTVHRNATPWHSDTEPRVVVDLALKDQDNQTLQTTRLLGSESIPTGKLIGWQALDAPTVAALSALLADTPAITVSQGVGGQVEVVLTKGDADNRTSPVCQLMGDTHPLYACDLTETGHIDADRAATVHAFLDTATEAVLPYPELFFQEGRTYISTGSNRIWNGITYALHNTRPAQTFQCRSVTADPDGEPIAFGILGTTKPWTPVGFTMATWERGWKATEPDRLTEK